MINTSFQKISLVANKYLKDNKHTVASIWLQSAWFPDTCLRGGVVGSCTYIYYLFIEAQSFPRVSLWEKDFLLRTHSYHDYVLYNAPGWLTKNSWEIVTAVQFLREHTSSKLILPSKLSSNFSITTSSISSISFESGLSYTEKKIIRDSRDGLEYVHQDRSTSKTAISEHADI